MVVFLEYQAVVAVFSFLPAYRDLFIDAEGEGITAAKHALGDGQIGFMDADIKPELAQIFHSLQKINRAF